MPELKIEDPREQIPVETTQPEKPTAKVPTEVDARKVVDELIIRLKSGFDAYTGQTLLSAAIVAAEARVNELENIRELLPPDSHSIVDDVIKWRKMVLNEVLKFKAIP